jgi:tetratricopeptide (TPR) repeat protein
VDSISGFEIWAERYDASVTGVFDLQDHIVTAVVRALQIRLLEGAQARVWHRSTDSVEAWACLTQGLAEYKHQTREGVIAARHLFSRAVEIDPNYAAAWAWLAYCHWHDARFLWNDRPEQSLVRASELAERALCIDDQLSEVHGVVGAIRVLQKDFDQAATAARKAVELSPNSSEAVALLSFVLNWAGEPLEAERYAEKAMATCPLYSGWYGATLAHSQRLLGSFQVARSSYEAVIRDLPGYIMPRLGLAVCLFEMGEVDAAQKEAADALRLVPGFSISRHLAVSGYRKEEHSARRLRAFQALKLVDR